MKPEDSRSKLQKAAIARGRLYLKSHLGFLPGFPFRQEGSTVVWMPLRAAWPGTDGQQHITAEMLRKATFGGKTLEHRFPKALPLIVEDAERWKRVLPRLLKILGQSVHEAAPLPISLFNSEWGFSRSVVEQASRIVRQAPALCPLLNALGWVTCLNPAQASTALAWVEANARPISNLLNNLPGSDGIVVTLALWDVANRNGQGRVAPLLAALGCPGGFDMATEGAQQYAEAWNRLLLRMFRRTRPSQWSFPERPPARWASSVLTFLAWLRDQPAKFARVALDLFACVFPDDVLPRWHAWWDQIERETAVARRLIAKAAADPGQSRRLLVEEARSTAERLMAIASHAPPPICYTKSSYTGATALLDTIRRISPPSHRNVHFPLLHILQAVERETSRELPRAAVLAEVNRWLNSSWLGDNRKERIGRVLHALHASGIPTAKLQNVIADSDFGDLLDRDANVNRECKALAFWLGELQQNCCLDTVFSLCRSIVDPSQIKAYLRDLASAESLKYDVWPETLRCAVQLAAPGRTFVSLLRSLHQAIRKDFNVVEDVLLVAKHLANSAWRHLTSEAVLDGDFRSLKSLALQLRMSQNLEIGFASPSYPEAVEVPPWASRYPEKLHASLALLAAVVPDAETVAAKLLGDAFPRTEQIHQEVRVIESRLAAAPSMERLARRLENLRRRLERPAEMPAGRLNRLDQKLQRAVRQEVFAAWHHELAEAIDAHVLRLLGTTEYPTWLREPRHQRVLAGILKLEGWARELGLRLLRLRYGPPPWNLIGESANQEFIAQLRNLGVDPKPWLDPCGPIAVTGANGRRVSLEIEHDPLEILQMGAYFDTCLSPGNVNFFSAVANAADINKRVVFARDDAGQVVGRCLLAIAENGGLLTFHRYCQDPQLGFDSMIADFAKDLSTRMTTVVVQRGRVRALVAGSWYDDGAIDLCSHFSCLEEGSAMRAELLDVNPAEVVTKIETAFAPLTISPLTLPMVLNLPEIQKRPELVPPLLSRILEMEGLDVETIIRAAELSHQAGASQEARRLLKRKALPMLVQGHRQLWYFHHVSRAAIPRITRVDPTVSLRVLRSTRPRGIRKDADETDADRRRLLAEAHAALGRTSKAARLMPQT